MPFSTKNLLPIIATVVLLIGISSTLYVNATKQPVDTQNPRVIINGEAYDIANLFTLFSEKTVTTDDGEFTGIPLDELIVYANVDTPENHHYTIKADDYQQTVNWEAMQNGIFYQERLRVIFPNLAHSFWMYDVVEIEVT